MSGSSKEYPSYLPLFKTGELRRRCLEAKLILELCTLCPHACGAKRLDGEKGKCGGGALAKVASYTSHFGEESPLVGCRGSGTIFFSYCPLHCVFCQNWDISQEGVGVEVSIEELSGMMISLQRLGCHNINLVTPTHFVPQILEALLEACQLGLCIPIVYNSGGYDSKDTLKLLNGVVDIYMPDIKYAREENAKRLSKVEHYPEVAKIAIREMYDQVGDLIVNDRGVAVRGLIIRHLVLPDGLAGTKDVLRFIAKEISTNSYVNIMDQYRPSFRSNLFRELSRRIGRHEYDEAVSFARELGLRIKKD